MNLTKEEEQLLIKEILEKFKHCKDYKKYRQLEQGCKIWRRGYLRTYNDNQPSYTRTREQKYFLGLIFRSVEQFAGDCKEALFSNNPFFVIRPRGFDPKSEAISEAVQAAMEYNTTVPVDYSLGFMRAYRHACMFGVGYLAPFYDYRERIKTTYSQQFNPLTGERRMMLIDENEAVADHPDFDVPYPTRVLVDPSAQFGKLHQTADYRMIERQRPRVWYLDNKENYGYSTKVFKELKTMEGSSKLDTEGPNNFDENWNIWSSKVDNEIEYVGRISDPKLLKGKFQANRYYLVTLVNRQLVVRCDINVAPDGLGLHAMNVIPDVDGSINGIGIVDPAVDYQRAVNEWYNLRMRGLAMAVNPAYIVNQNALPNWKQLEDHPPGKIFPSEIDMDARRVLQTLNPADTSGATWEQMMGFTQRDHDLTVGTSASRLGSIEGQKRTATELTQVKEGADRRSNHMIYTAIRTGHKPNLISHLKYTLSFWSTPRTLMLINSKTFERRAVRVTPQNIRNADVILDIIDSTGGSVDQQMAFYAKLYQLALQDPMIDRTATLVNMLKNSRIVKDPYELLKVDPRMQQRMQQIQMQRAQMAGNEEADRLIRNVEREGTLV